MIDRFAGCFRDERRPDLIEHEVATLVGHGCSGSHLATRISTLTTNCATIR